MNLQKVLFATDFSPASETALAVATALARAGGAELIIAHVEQPPVLLGSEEMMGSLYEINSDRARQQLERILPDADDVRYRHELRVGSPAEELAELAQQEQADLLVVGTHGRTTLTRLLLGSIAEALVRKAPCPVLTVKPGAVATPVEE
jgi:nucleotide-binding universal stress UspA family protein